MGLEAQQPRRIGKHGPRVGFRKARALQPFEEHFSVTPRHVGRRLAVTRRIAEIPPAVDHLFRRSAADAQLQTPTSDDVRGTRILGHVHRVFVAHVDDGGPDLNRLRARADGGEERERRAELACEVVHAEVRAVEAQLFGRYGELDRLQKGIGRRADIGVWRWCPVPEGEKADSFHGRCLREKVRTFGYVCRPVQDSLSKKRYTAAIRPSLAMMKSVPAYSGASPGRPDTHWTRPPLPNSSGGTMG